MEVNETGAGVDAEEVEEAGSKTRHLLINARERFHWSGYLPVLSHMILMETPCWGFAADFSRNFFFWTIKSFKQQIQTSTHETRGK